MGESASDGTMTDRTIWRSWTTTEEELGLSANALARALDVPTNRITAILREQRGVTADTALRLARYFGTTPQLWQNLQKTYELRVAEIESGPQIRERVQRGGPAAHVRRAGLESRARAVRTSRSQGVLDHRPPPSG